MYKMPFVVPLSLRALHPAPWHPGQALYPLSYAPIFPDFLIEGQRGFKDNQIETTKFRH